MTDVIGLRAIEFEGDKKALFCAYLAAQKEMGDLLKTSTNPAFKSKYADLAAVIEAVLPALHNNGFALMQPPHSDGALVEVETLLLHESGGYVRSVLGLRPSKQDPQGVGSAVTYGRRYALQAIAGIAPEDDDGNAASGPVKQPTHNGAEAAAITQLRNIKDVEIFKACWAKNKDGWKAILPADGYARVGATMKECSAKFAPAKSDAESDFRPASEGRMANGQHHDPNDGYGIPADEIPF